MSRQHKQPTRPIDVRHNGPQSYKDKSRKSYIQAHGESESIGRIVEEKFADSIFVYLFNPMSIYHLVLG